MKSKILIRAHTARRDGAPAVLLKKFLESENSVFVSSVINFNYFLKYWRPDIVIIFTVSIALDLRKKFPNIKVIFVDGEVIQYGIDDLAKFFKDNVKLLDSIDLLLLGSSNHISAFKKNGLPINKLKVIGNTRFDSARFYSNLEKRSLQKKIIGMVGAFPLLNHHEGYPAIRSLKNKANLRYSVAQISNFYVFREILEFLLNKTNYEISIRPHPSESSDNYKTFVINKYPKALRSRISVDSTIDFSSWAKDLKVLISSSSTSFVESMIVGTPVINYESISDQKIFFSKYAELFRIGHKNCHQLGKIKDLKKIISKIKPIEIIPNQLKKILIKECDWNNSELAVSRASKYINEFIKNENFRIKLGLPFFIVSLIDNLKFYRNLKKNKHIHNFNYNSRYHGYPKPFDEFLKNK